MTDAMIAFRCRGCEELVSFAGPEAGTVQDCPECGGWVDVPELTRHAKAEDPLIRESERQFEENARLLEGSVRSHEESERQWKQCARYQDQAEETFARLAAPVTRRESLTDELEKRLGGPR